MIDAPTVGVRDRLTNPADVRPWSAHLLVFVLAAASALQLVSVTITLLSVVCLLLFPAYLMITHRGVDLLPLVLAAVAWLSFLASCVVNHVSPLYPNALAPAAFGLYLIGLTVLTQRSIGLIATALAGLAVGTTGFFFTEGIELSNTGSFLDFWKYGIAHAVTVLLVFTLSAAASRPFVPPVALAIIGLANLALNFRSLALICVLASAILFARNLLDSRVGRGWQFAIVIAFGAVFGTLMPAAARLGAFGPALKEKTLLQDTTHLPVLLAGRTEPPMTITAIVDRPLLGWGSASNLTADVYARAEHLAVERFGFDPTFPFEKYWRLPVQDYSGFHSILFGTWAEGGLLAAMFPLFLLFTCLAIVWNFRRFGRWAPLVLMMGLQGLWDLFYAPWTYNVIAEYACIVLLFGAVHFGRRSAVHAA